MFPIDFCHIPVSIIKRSEGRSAVAAAAYRSGTKRLCEVDEKNFYAEWHDMAQRVGLQPDMTPYCLRHTTATLLAVEKVAPAIIKEVLGHTDYAVTLGYTHIPLEEKLDAMNKLK